MWPYVVSLILIILALLAAKATIEDEKANREGAGCGWVIVIMLGIIALIMLLLKL